MHIGKTKVIFNNYAEKNDIKVNKKIEIVDYISSCVYIFRKVIVGWNTLRKLAEILKGNLPLYFNKSIFNQCILLVIMTPGCKIMVITRRHGS